MTVQRAPTVAAWHDHLLAEHTAEAILADALVSVLRGDALTVRTAWIRIARARSVH